MGFTYYNNYESTHSRDDQGSYVVRLPLKDGHNSESSQTTKLRIVFNGSSKTEKDQSLNEVLHVGPNLLPDLTDLILRWRSHEFAFAADISKMFRQIRVHPADQHLQSILWRYKLDQPVSSFRLTTVPFGLTCSPYLAVRTLRQLASDQGDDHPLGAQVLTEEVYMDDVLSGAETIDAAKTKQADLINLCKVGGFPLHKWLASNQELLHQLQPADLATETELGLYSDASFAVLGLSWNPKDDVFLFKCQVESVNGPVTKRSVLSRVAKLFDPLGWLGPVIIAAKILMQSLWLLKLGWDAELPQPETDKWIDWCKSLERLPELRIPRWMGTSPDVQFYELHGFADASTRAYGAALYLRVVTRSKSEVNFLIAKTKVAPLKTLSIPRLELCAAHLLARLVNHVQKINLQIPSLQVHLWSDSIDVLYWLSDHPARWQTFVANRCSQIATLVPDAFWHHVRSSDNPADAASRGIPVDELINSSLWWHGPPYLTDTLEAWLMANSLPLPSVPTEARQTTHHQVSIARPPWELMERYSDLLRLARITSYCLRFLSKLILRRFAAKSLSQPKIPIFLWEFPDSDTRSCSSDEIRQACLYWAWQTQVCHFSREREIVRNKATLLRSSSLRGLDPTLEKGLLRVGGRLRNSLLSQDQKHPVILPPEATFTRLLIQQTHANTLHDGIQLTLSTLRQNYWVVRGRQAVRGVISTCTTCKLFQPTPLYQKMGNLPPHRIQPARPFSRSGVDYAGPLKIRTTPGRGYKSTKGYNAVFVCQSTKAVHLEAVSRYDTAAFLAAFKRFTSRRGRYTILLSDQGTNFVGADTELKQLYSPTSKHSQSLYQSLANEGTTWKFNTPGAAHFGGLWEAAVKSTKHHLRRVIGDNCLTFEELSTLLCQIEACLNSRPLVPLHDDPGDLEALTPAHFLIGETSFLITEPRLTDIKVPPLKRWMLLTQMTQHFWERWSREYLQHLQRRQKWNNQVPSPNVGDLVLIKNELTPPAKWPLARITKLHPGDDQLTRVVTLRTANNELKRPIVKIIPLVSVE